MKQPHTEQTVEHTETPAEHRQPQEAWYTGSARRRSFRRHPSRQGECGAEGAAEQAKGAIDLRRSELTGSSAAP